MKTSRIISYILLAVLVLCIILSVVVACFFISNHNRLVELKSNVTLQYSQIQVNLQRRIDLIPNYIETVKGEMKHDETIVSMISQARSNVISTMESGDIAKTEEAVANYDVAVDKYLNFIVENYPELSAGQAFQGLRDELAGTENRIAVSRQYYNEAVAEYNLALDTFPGVLLGPIMKFEHAEPFNAVEGSEVSPTVKFD